MNFYAYQGTYKLGKEPLGSSGKLLFRLTTIAGAIRRCQKVYGRDTAFRLFIYTNVYDARTYKEVGPLAWRKQ